MGLIDLHTHTTFSDGSDAPEELISKAIKSGVSTLSITDHNTINAYYRLEKRPQSLKIIRGVELSASIGGLLVEIIGYGFDLGKMQEFIDQYYDHDKLAKKEKDLFPLIKAKMFELGYKLDPNLEYEPPFCTTAFETELWKHQENLARFPEQLAKCPELFYRYLNDPESELYTFDLSNPSCSQVVEAIHRAGGKAFLAHPYIYLIEDHLELVRKVALISDLDGVEVFHSRHSQEHKNNLLALAKELKLLVSGGSDYHGTYKPDISLGKGCGDLKVPADYITWIDKLACTG